MFSILGGVISRSGGGSRKLKKWGAGTPILERGGRKTAFERFQCFSYKSFVKFSRKGGTAALPAASLNPRMTSKYSESYFTSFCV